LLGRDPSVDGVKTGHTEAAGYCLVASALRDGMRLVSVVMSAESDAARAQASQALLNYGFRFYENRTVYAAADKVATGRVWKGEVTEVEVGVREAVIVSVPRAAGKGRLSARAELHKPLLAPLKKAQPVGELVVSLGGVELARAPLEARQSVAAGSWLGQGLDSLRLLFE
jgi:D-alanyl-D-alanine carboxypeptidase (penicillin-binding protein 5/6)